jgi:hypothetical protein
MLFNPNGLFQRVVRSLPGQIVLGAIIGGLLIAFAGIQDPWWFLGGMLAGAIAVVMLARVEF